MDLLRSYQLQDGWGQDEYNGFDGEVIEGNPTSAGVFNRTSSHVMSFDKPGNLCYYVFDDVTEGTRQKPFYQRLEAVERRIREISLPDQFQFVEHVEVNNLEELLAAEEEALEAGFEGLMLRNPVGPYKENRATFLQNLIHKLKRVTDDEATVVDFEEGFTNLNAQTRDTRGFAKRSKAQEGLVLSGTLGKFVCNYRGQVIRVAPGAFTHPERDEIFQNQNKYRNKLLKFRFFAYGIKDLPRQPRALGWRDPIDV
jgi:hypothetical protein